ncbi:uncharacterized protein LOC108193574 isoform X1 [Daucus carota subsp. sativus]|uniref:uncharacterized protein LOC108193574 isoform X1 n=1 Tax=Daucus carota subsp. sativus TaxID=79200 RepID=UPI003083603E
MFQLSRRNPRVNTLNNTKLQQLLKNTWVRCLNNKFAKSKRMQKMVVSSVSCPRPDPGLRSWPEPSSVTVASPCMAPGSSCMFPRPNPNLAPSSAHQFSPSNAPGFCSGPSQIPNQPFQRSPVPNHYPNYGPRPRPHYQPNYSGFKRKATSGFQHQGPHKPQLPQENYIAIDSSGNMFCKLCEVPCTGPFCLKQHLKGHKHKAKLHLLKMDRKNGGEQVNTQLRCDLCQILCPHEDALKLHYQGQKHKARLQALEAGQKKVEKATERPWCGLCEIWCMNEDAFNQHLKGQKHLTRLYSMQEKERAMKASCR